jgi:hypothetical protein
LSTAGSIATQNSFLHVAVKHCDRVARLGASAESLSSAVILADAKGKAKIMILVTHDGTPMLNFVDDSGNVIQSLPEAKVAGK